MTYLKGTVVRFMWKGIIYSMEADTVEEVTPVQSADLLRKAQISMAKGIRIGGKTYTLDEWAAIVNNKRNELIYES